ncbi:tripartite tricarboxylate transporter TctB family protein [Streptomyces sp. NPDC052309]|uniref:Tripartite tricarboxylate transporter TctB family protein n=1 Tax=Streptomyces griseicoloratus TaxID=2752516 RepID=A0A926L6R2_9ACTN|nr:tripartite tricarboxylate transporter TctB family protein [Streptomyces griseicoloratus]MBD0423647.1 tripartite tricarboxylate transporter TctB family protein [Streptomyces griseicoloratus]
MTNSVSPGATVTGTGEESDAAEEITGPGAPRRRGGARSADFVIAVALLVIFTAAFVTALQWQAIAGLFPLIATGTGIALSAAFAVSSLLSRERERPSEPGPASTGPAAGQNAEDAEGTEDDQADADHLFFASLGRQDWTVSLAYFAAFFSGLYVFGLYVASVVFTVVYLRFQARSSWLFSAVYAVVLAAAVYALFGMALELPVPEGLLELTGRR